MAKSRLWMVRIVAAVAVSSGLSWAQTPAAPAFEVASVKPGRPGSTNPGIRMLADRFEATSVPLQGLISLAYGEAGPPPRTRANDQIVGGPRWMDTDLFDIVAKTGSDVPAGPAGVGQKLLMLRSLLEQRFKLAVHHEDRDASIYTLVLARSDGTPGPRLRRTDVDCRALLMARGGAPPPPLAAGGRPPCGAVVSVSGTLIGGGQTMATLANTLSRMTNRVVLDRTGLPGSFDVDLQFNPDGLDGLAPPSPDRAASIDDRPSIFAALQEQLGLKLESTRGPIDMLVVDRAERPEPD